MTSVSVRPVKASRDFKTFVKLPWPFYQGDPAWVPPLIQERLDLINPKKNPFFKHAEAEFFIAYRDNKPVGRISAQIDRLHNQTHGEKTGFFGMFESENSLETAKALFQTAENWLQGRGMDRIRGPFNLSINGDSGFLVDGYEHPPFILTGHNPPHYVTLVEGCGYQKLKDWFCWAYDPLKPVPEAPLEVAEAVRKYPGLTIREVDPKHLERDMGIILDVFNSAWSKNWGFVPLTESEIKKATQEFKLILEPKMVLIAEVKGEPAAICLALSNIHEAIQDLNGRLLPFGFLKLLYRLKRKKIRSVRLIMLGVKKFRGDVLGGLSVLLYCDIHRRGRKLGYTKGELSMTLEDNVKVNMGIEFMGGKKYKTYRIYEKKL